MLKRINTIKIFNKSYNKYFSKNINTNINTVDKTQKYQQKYQLYAQFNNFVKNINSEQSKQSITIKDIMNKMKYLYDVDSKHKKVFDSIIERKILSKFAFYSLSSVSLFLLGFPMLSPYIPADYYWLYEMSGAVTYVGTIAGSYKIAEDRTYDEVRDMIVNENLDKFREGYNEA